MVWNWQNIQSDKRDGEWRESWERRTCNMVEESSWSAGQTIICGRLLTRAIPTCGHTNMEAQVTLNTWNHMSTWMHPSLTWNWWHSLWSFPQRRHVAGPVQQWQGPHSFGACSEDKKKPLPPHTTSPWTAKDTARDRKYNFPIQSNLSFQKTPSNLPSNSGNFLQFAPLLNTQLI